MNKEKIKEFCIEQLKRKGLYEKAYIDRLELEFSYIEDQNEYEYLHLLLRNKLKFKQNENNLLVMYLLDIAPNFNISIDPEFEYGEFPDIDVDYVPVVRDYLKNDWARKQFGERNICAIGNYTTFGIKSSLIDMARVHGKPRDEILALTTKIGLKDDEGKALTWEKVLEIHPDLKNYCDNNPDVADAAKVLLDRKRGMGKHAGGLVISSSPIDELVPLCLGKDGDQVSSWTEGLHEQDLQPVGLIKYDLLVITDIYRIALIVKLIKERHGLLHINALPNQRDWSDLSYLNDKKALSLANMGDLKGIFQFDSDGIRKLCRQGGVTRFDDLVAYAAIFRPGPLSMKMHEAYCNRKKGFEKFELHPTMQPILGKTYGVIVYQEQIMQLLHKIGDIPLKDCEIVRKAISKKKEKQFAKYKEQFIEHGQNNLESSKEYLENLWAQIEAFAGYGFNKAHSVAYTYISAMLLWLKAHYPLEFYTQTLSLEKETDKIKEYMNDARSHNIDIEPVNVNISKVDFNIHDDKIYYGLSKIKGIGKEVAARIEENSPYNDFKDFLDKFGTESRVVLPLIALGAFDEDKCYMHKFYEHYREVKKKTAYRGSRFKTRMNILKEEFYELTKDIDVDIDALFGMPRLIEANADEMFLVRLKNFIENAEIRTSMKELWKKWKKSVNVYFTKEKEQENIEEFDSDEHYLSGDYQEIYLRPDIAEEMHYGFIWIHPLEKSKHYKGYTFDRHQQDVVAENLISSPVEVQIISVTQRTSKNGNDYWQLRVEDSNSQRFNINVWKDDYRRWEEELKKDNFVRLSLQPPSGGFSTYTLARAEKAGPWRQIVDKDNDYRVFVMDKPVEETATITPVEDIFSDLIEIN